MKAVLLKPKDDSRNENLVVFDDLIKSFFSDEFYLPVFTGASKGFRIITFSHLMDNYKFPRDKNGNVKCRFLFYCIEDLQSLDNLEFYIDDSIQIEEI